MDKKDKAIGTFLGIAIGDALGMPVESKPLEYIVENYGRIEKYHPATNHKWFDGEKVGSWTDDTQLTLAVANGILNCKDLFDHNSLMDSIAEQHILAMQESTKGWGRSTREAVRNLSNGKHWSVSGAEGGNGNGVAMKIAPLALIKSATINDMLAFMTHKSAIAIESSFLHIDAIKYCFNTSPNGFKPQDFIDYLISDSLLEPDDPCDDEADDNFLDRLSLLKNYKEWDAKKISEEFGAGSCYCYNSLPFTYMFFLKNPTSIESMYDVVSAGGDTDSNASMLGGLLGALNGTKIFPKHLIDELDQKKLILDTAKKFSELV